MDKESAVAILLQGISLEGQTTRQEEYAIGKLGMSWVLPMVMSCFEAASRFWKHSRRCVPDFAWWDEVPQSFRTQNLIM